MASRSTPNKPCIFCGDRDGSCLSEDNGVIVCYDGLKFKDSPPSGYRFVKKARSGMGAVFAPINDEPSQSQQKPREYTYHTADGQPYQLVRRYYPKKFAQLHWDGRTWQSGLPKGFERVPYRLPEVQRSQLIGIVEGEKDCNTSRTSGLEAELEMVLTTNPQGAGKWPQGWGQKYFAGKDVIIFPDNDLPGFDHARQVYQDLQPYTRSLAIVRLPDLPKKGDLTDFLAGNGTIRAVKELVEQALSQPHKFTLEQPPESTDVSEQQAISLALLSLVNTPVNLPPIKPICEWMLYPRYLTKLAAPPRTFKSTISITLAVAIAKGESFYDYKASQAKVLIVDQDSPDRHWTQQALSQADPDWHKTGNIYLLNPDDPRYGRLTLPEHGQLLKETIKALGIKVLILDTLRSLTKRSGLDENSNRDMAAVLATLEDIARECNCAVLIIHHTSKAGKRGAGAGVLESDVQIEFSLQRVVEINTGNRFIRLKCMTSRFGEPPPLWFDLPPTPDSPGMPPPPLIAVEDEIGRCRLSPDPCDEESFEGKEPGTRELVLAELKEEPSGTPVKNIATTLGKT